MRIRKKKWAAPELAACPYYIENASEKTGKWHSEFADNSRPLYLELGCGKGIFVTRAALRNPDINYIAADIKSDMLAVGRRNIEREFGEAGRTPDNLRLLQMNIANISKFFSPEDSVDRIYINFCNPWNRGKHNKRRLTHSRQLVQYRTIMKEGSELHFKTDDDVLFEESLPYFEESGFDILYITRDLHAGGYEGNIVTEHEKMFSDQGIKIKLLVARPDFSKTPKMDAFGNYAVDEDDDITAE
ncbi:MAG: tRNA (guanosine(46)-N7)-methyltransferase TrmB [Huintestinicola sp.]